MPTPAETEQRIQRHRDSSRGASDEGEASQSFGDRRAPDTPTLNIKEPSRPLSRELQMREAVLLAFCDPVPGQCLRLRNLSGKEWKRLLHWLDTSGLALYFFDRMVELRLCDVLPAAITARLQQNLIDNTERTRGMVDESIAIHLEFQSAHLSYATFKGFSLWPYSVPKPELRSQLDLEFLVAEKSMPKARAILERRGYRLHAVSGRSWEFKANEITRVTLEDLYKTVPFRSVELHMEASIQGRRSLLARAETRGLPGIGVPVLSPVDLFLGQGLHLYKHVCSEFSRTAHLIEFRRHVLARRDDSAFWDKLQLTAAENPRAYLELGVVTLLIAQVMGDFAPTAFTSWTVDRLPFSARLWVELYGRRCIFASFPGSKLYLLLQRGLEAAGVPERRSLRRSLLPLRLPPAIMHAPATETPRARLRRQCMELRFILFRLRFHITAGLRYKWESIRWRQRMNRFAR